MITYILGVFLLLRVNFFKGEFISCLTENIVHVLYPVLTSTRPHCSSTESFSLPFVTGDRPNLLTTQVRSGKLIFPRGHIRIGNIMEGHTNKLCNGKHLACRHWYWWYWCASLGVHRSLQNLTFVTSMATPSGRFLWMYSRYTCAVQPVIWCSYRDKK